MLERKGRKFFYDEQEISLSLARMIMLEECLVISGGVLPKRWQGLTDSRQGLKPWKRYFTDEQLKELVLFMKSKKPFNWYCREAQKPMSYIYRGYEFFVVKMESLSKHGSIKEQSYSYFRKDFAQERPTACFQVEVLKSWKSANKSERLKYKNLRQGYKTRVIFYGYIDHQPRYDRNITILFDHVIAKL